MGVEAGEALDGILARKEVERTACDGIFYWGIGSAVGPGLAGLVAEVEAPEVLFSLIKSPPRAVDRRPSHVVRWAGGRGLFGERVELPDAACVTSRWNPLRPTTPRYALVCARESPLALDEHGELRVAQLRNLRSGAPVGASQVTAVVRRTDGTPDGAAGSTYPVALRAFLVWPYVIRLTEPAPPIAAKSSLEPFALPLGL